ncbi:MAG: nucleotidyltransferase family protein [Candidatus Binatia bacterium]
MPPAPRFRYGRYVVDAQANSLLDSSLREVRRIVLEGLGDCRAKVWLFGSRASGGAREGSDIDVAVLPLDSIRPGVFASIRDALEESPVPWNVDLVDLTTASPALRANVEKEGIAWRD